MSWEAWFTLATVAVVVILLTLELTTPAAVVLGGVVALLVGNVIDSGEALAGFGNPAPMTVAALYVVAAGVERTGLVQRLVDLTMGDARRERGSLARLTIPTAAASAFVNNTPIVAMAAPAVGRWSDRVGQPVSRLLMPLSFAAILGGMVTVIGTSTHIVVSGLLVESGFEPFGFFEVARMGLPIAVIGVVVMVLLAPRLLPDRRSARGDIEDAKEYTVEMLVLAGGPVDGLSIGQASLRHLAGVFLVQVERDDRIVGAVGPDFVLQGQDVLRFVGNARNATDLHATPGLRTLVDSRGAIPRGPMAFFEAVVGVGSSLVGRSLRDTGFRDRFKAVVLAIHRADQRVMGKLGDARLRVGDTLLVLAEPSFRERVSGTGDFLMVSRLDAVEPHRSEKGRVAGAVGAATLVAAATGALSILEAALLGAFGMVAGGVLSPREARRSVDLDVIVLIAASFGLGAAIATSGLAARLAELVVSGVDPSNEVVVLVALAGLTLLLTEAITNNAAAVLAFPIGLELAARTGIDPHLAALTVSIAASASFLTPIGYQTNTMVWGPGGYRFWDYARLGLPLTLLTVATVAFVAAG